MAYETLIVEVEDYVSLIRLNRPEAMNALNSQLMRELAAAVTAAEANERVRCIVITGSEKAFAAGADVKEMAEKSFIDVYFDDLFGPEARTLAQARKPIIAAVSRTVSPWATCEVDSSSSSVARPSRLHADRNA